MLSDLVLHAFTQDVVRDRRQELRLDFLEGETRTRLARDLTLRRDLLASQVSLVVRLVVRFATSDEILTASRMLHVLDAHVDALTSNATADLLVDLHTHRARRHVPHLTRSALVLQVRHTLLLRRVNLDVDIVTDTERAQVRRGVQRTVLTVTAGEEVTGTVAETAGPSALVTHL